MHVFNTSHSIGGDVYLIQAIIEFDLYVKQAIVLVQFIRTHVKQAIVLVLITMGEHKTL